MPVSRPSRFVERYTRPLLRLLRGLFGQQVLFDAAFYREQNPDVARGWLPPLWHYLLWGSVEGRRPHPQSGAARPPMRRPAPTLSKTNTWFGAGWLNRRGAARPDAAAWKNGVVPAGAVIPVLSVCGPAEVDFVRRLLIPALAAEDMPARVALHLVNYEDNTALAEGSGFGAARGALASITDWSPRRKPGRAGFGEAVNFLFEAVKPSECFLLVNPDSFPMPGCLARLLGTYSESGAAIVEARQWPREHPKEYDPETGDTPWASAAFCLISAEAFRRLGGFDPAYFLYLEDVDLSWRAWLADMPVRYEPRAVCYHATGLHFRRADRHDAEDYFSCRNFLALAYKFFGPRGEREARRWLRGARFPPPFERAVIEAYESLRPSIKRVGVAKGPGAAKIKITGFNRFHEMRTEVMLD
jgi:hypothetical protein